MNLPADFGPQDLAPLIDHTLLRPEATWHEVDKLCDEARQYHFAAVCIHPIFVGRVRQRLAGSGVRTCTVVGFPLGGNTCSVKRYEAEAAVSEGAEEIDMVIAIGALKAGDERTVRDEIAAVVQSAGNGAGVKVIIEACFLTATEIGRACLLALDGGARFVKTSTGFGPAGASIGVVQLMAATVGGRLGIKAAGGIRDYATARALVTAGATRLGTSASLAVIGVAAGS